MAERKKLGLGRILYGSDRVAVETDTYGIAAPDAVRVAVSNVRVKRVALFASRVACAGCMGRTKILLGCRDKTF